MRAARAVEAEGARVAKSKPWRQCLGSTEANDGKECDSCMSRTKAALIIRDRIKGLTSVPRLPFVRLASDRMGERAARQKEVVAADSPSHPDFSTGSACLYMLSSSGVHYPWGWWTVIMYPAHSVCLSGGSAFSLSNMPIPFPTRAFAHAHFGGCECSSEQAASAAQRRQSASGPPRKCSAWSFSSGPTLSSRRHTDRPHLP